MGENNYHSESTMTKVGSSHLCNICGFSTEYLRSFKVHLEIHESKAEREAKKKFSCDICNFKTKYNKHLKVHLKTHEPPNIRNMNKRYSCHQCDHKSDRKCDMEKHIDTHKSKEERRVCNICYFSADTIALLKIHKKTHKQLIDMEKKQDNARNGKAEKITSTKKLQNKVRADVHECNQCDFKTVHLKNLKLHMHIHDPKDVQEERKIYTCHICDFKTSYNRNLRNHLGLHEPEKKFSCNVCNFSAATTLLLKRHQKTHNKVHKCSICDYKTAFAQNLRTHISIHDPEDMKELNKKYVCHICNFRTRLNQSLRAHLVTHETEKRHVCDICNFATKTTHLLKKHKGIMHNEERKQNLKMKNKYAKYRKLVNPKMLSDIKNMNDDCGTERPTSQMIYSSEKGSTVQHNSENKTENYRKTPEIEKRKNYLSESPRNQIENNFETSSIGSERNCCPGSDEENNLETLEHETRADPSKYCLNNENKIKKDLVNYIPKNGVKTELECNSSEGFPQASDNEEDAILMNSNVIKRKLKTQGTEDEEYETTIFDNVKREPETQGTESDYSSFNEKDATSNVIKREPKTQSTEKEFNAPNVLGLEIKTENETDYPFNDVKPEVKQEIDSDIINPNYIRKFIEIPTSKKNVSKKKMKFKCTVCGFETIYHNSMKKHINQHDPSKCTCEFCDFVAPTDIELQQHRKIHKPLLCFKCGFRTAHRYALAVHMELHDPKDVKEARKKHACDKCDFKTRYKKHLKTHLLLHLPKDERENTARFPCEHCYYKTNRLYDLQKHVERIHVNKSTPNVKTRKLGAEWTEGDIASKKPRKPRPPRPSRKKDKDKDKDKAKGKSRTKRKTSGEPKKRRKKNVVTIEDTYFPDMDMEYETTGDRFEWELD